VAPISLSNPTYDIETSFSPIARLGSVPLVMVTSAESPVKTFAQLSDEVRAHPDNATYASTGNGAPGQIFMESVKSKLAMKIREVPYKSSVQALTDIIGGHVLVSIVSLPAADQLIQQGRLRVLAVGSRQRLA
jgi:tripartite-type tricarboxylate transporter receptor subunit TctC